MWIPKHYGKTIDPLGYNKIRYSRSHRFEPVSIGLGIAGLVAANQANKGGSAKSVPQDAVARNIRNQLLLPSLFGFSRERLGELFGKKDDEGNTIYKWTEEVPSGGGKGNGTKIKKFRGTLDEVPPGIVPKAVGVPSGPTLIKKLIAEGHLDEFAAENLNPKREVFQGDRVADLTEGQKAALGRVRGIGDQIGDPQDFSGTQGRLDQILNSRTAGPQATVPPTVFDTGTTGGDLNLTVPQDLIDSNTAVSQVLTGGNTEATTQLTTGQTSTELGTDGPEVVTAQEDLTVIPNQDQSTVNLTEGGGVTALGAGPTSGPLTTESNTVGLTEEELRTIPGVSDLPGRAEGGEVRKGESFVAGERGPETALATQTNQAVSRALTGAPSTDINTGATENFIQKAVADPSRRAFKEETSQAINAASAGPGFFGTNRTRELSHAKQNVEQNIAATGADLRFKDEQARRSLAESGANRSLNAVSTALNVQNNPLAQRQTEANIAQTGANIGATQTGTARSQALLGGELGQQQANIGATQAGTAASEFGTERGQALLGGELGQQEANLQQTQAGIDQTLANTSLTSEQQTRVSGLIQQDIASTGQITAQTENIMRQAGMIDAQIDQVKANTASTDVGTIKTAGEIAGDLEQQRQNVISSQLSNTASELNIAGIEQTQNQLEINAELQKFFEENEIAFDTQNQLMEILGTGGGSDTVIS